MIIKIKPLIVHAITIKPIIYSGTILRFFPRISLVVSFAGLGHVFKVDSFFSLIRLALVKKLYKFLLKKVKLKVIFQNKDDLRLITKISELPLNKTHLINGSGVDLNLYKFCKIPNGKPLILFASRILKAKGIYEFVESAKKIKAADFIIAGKIDKDNPTSINLSQLKEWSKLPNIEYIGHKSNMHELIHKSTIVVLPSYYGEGLPKILIEASACGRPIITTDHPGCRDAIIHGKTGLLVPIKNVNEIVKAIRKLINSRDLIFEMSKSARIHAEKNFDINEVTNIHLSIYDELLKLNQ